MADTPRDEIQSDASQPDASQANATQPDAAPAQAAASEPPLTETAGTEPAAVTGVADASSSESGGESGGDGSSEVPVPPSPAPEPAAEEPSPEPAPALEATTTVAPLSAAGTGDAGAGSEGGEWELLVQKLRQWWASGRLQSFWQQARSPLTFALGLVALLLVLRVYAGLLSAINSLPLIPGLLELVGVIWVLRNGLPRVIRRTEREQLIEGLQQRWRSFSGRS